MDTMRCAVWMGGRDFVIEHRPVPEPGPGQVRVRVHACGVCLTEVHTLDGLIGQPGRGFATPPKVVGHEYGGLIEAIGPGVTGLQIGMPVACAGQGGFAEKIVLPANYVFPIPAGVPMEQAAQVEPYLCSLSAMQNGEMPPEASVLVTGAGPMGLMLVQLARRNGATKIYVSELSPDRRAMALRLGADEAFDPREAVLRETTEGVDVAFETAGVPAALADCISAAKDRGMIVMVGVHPSAARLELDLYTFHRRNLTLRASYGSTGKLSFAEAAQALGQIDLEALVSHRFDLSDIAEAFDIARTGRGLKVLVGAGIGGSQAEGPGQ